MTQRGMVRVLDRIRLLALTMICVTGGAVPALAQYSVPEPPPFGEKYHIEASYGWWNADPSLIVNSESLGILGTDVDLVDDLGIEQNQLGKVNVVLRPAMKHKFRFEYLPIKYEAETTLQREFIFNGQLYRVGLPVNTEATFTTYSFGYEYDFLHRTRGFVGVLLDAKYTDVNVELTSPISDPEFTTAVAVVPTIGFVSRGYLTKNFAVGGEISFFRIPDTISEDYNGSYNDFDIYATYNFTKYVGATTGYRRTTCSTRPNATPAT